MSSLTKTLNKILGLTFVVAVIGATASFYLMSSRVLREAEAESIIRAQEILNGQMADMTRALHEGRDTMISLRGEVLVANYRSLGLAIGIYTRERSPIYESAASLDLASALFSDAGPATTHEGRSYVWTPIELGRETIGHAVFSTVIDKGDQQVVLRSLVVSILMLLLAIGTVFFLSRIAIRRTLVEPIEQINRELPRLRAIVEGTVPVRSALRPDRAGTTEKVERSNEIALLRGTLFDFSIRLRASSEAHRHAQSELVRSEAIHQLARQTGHDIRSPLAALETMLQGSNGVSEERSKVLRLAVKRIQDIASNLLHLEHDHEPRVAPLPLTLAGLSDVASELVEEKKVMAPSGTVVALVSNLRDTDFAKTLAAADLSLSDMRRVLSNLLTNSLEALSEGGHVTLELTLAGSTLRVRIEDNGCGISKENQRRLFERGFTKGKTEGNGLGLSYVKDRVTSWGGEVTVVSQVGHGTTVDLHLPLALADVERTADAS